MTRPVCAWINSDHLRHNYRLLKQQAGQAELMAVVKADAYGHDMTLVSTILHAEGCRHFGVTDAAEGEALRHIITDPGCSITLLSGIFDAQDAQLAAARALSPAIIDDRQLSLLIQAGFRGKIWIKVDTGMNRLGADDPAGLFQSCQRQGIGIAGVMSHLACADMPAHPLNDMQARRFDDIRRDLPLPASLLNSAGLITLPTYALDMVRPGIALYGCEPVPEQPLGLKPVMHLRARIIQTRHVRKDDTISYAATFRAPRDMQLGIIAAGYADGIPRSLSNCGHVMLDGIHLPVIGRVCMDYTMVDISGTHARTGSMVECWGSGLPAHEVARTAGTIAYELFTGIGARVPRRLQT